MVHGNEDGGCLRFQYPVRLVRLLYSSGHLVDGQFFEAVLNVYWFLTASIILKQTLGIDFYLIDTLSQQCLLFC